MVRNFFFNAVSAIRSSTKSSRRKPARGFSQPMESLEARVVLTTQTPIGPIDVMPAHLDPNTHELTITAKEGGHAVQLKTNGDKLEVWLDGKLRTSHALNQVQSVKFTGTAGNDSFDASGLGSKITVTASGLAGNDTLMGGGGQDVLIGGDGNDLVDGAGGADNITGGDGNDTLRGDGGDDSLTGGNGDDFIVGGIGNDKIEAEAGNDSVFGGAGNDSIRGGDGDDVLEGGDGNDWIVGNMGQDVLKGGSGNDCLYGGGGNDQISGGIGNDRIRGTGGFDKVDGGFGKDFVKGDNNEVSVRSELTSARTNDVFSASASELGLDEFTLAAIDQVHSEGAN